jgi:hypothetical protein
MLTELRHLILKVTPAIRSLDVVGGDIIPNALQVQISIRLRTYLLTRLSFLALSGLVL